MVKKQIPIIDFKADDHHATILEKRAEPYLYDLDSSRVSKKSSKELF